MDAVRRGKARGRAGHRRGHAAPPAARPTSSCGTSEYDTAHQDEPAAARPRPTARPSSPACATGPSTASPPTTRPTPSTTRRWSTTRRRSASWASRPRWRSASTGSWARACIDLPQLVALLSDATRRASSACPAAPSPRARPPTSPCSTSGASARSTPARFESKGRNTPFAGWILKGWPVLTIVGGRVAWKDRALTSAAVDAGIADYHRLLEADPAAAARAVGVASGRLPRARASPSTGEPMPTLPAAAFRRTRRLGRAARRRARGCWSSPPAWPGAPSTATWAACARSWARPAAEARWVALDPGRARRRAVAARRVPDAGRARASSRSTATRPRASATATAMAAVFAELPVFRAFARRHAVALRAVGRRGSWRRCWPRWRGRRGGRAAGGDRRLGGGEDPRRPGDPARGLRGPRLRLRARRPARAGASADGRLLAPDAADRRRLPARRALRAGRDARPR